MNPPAPHFLLYAEAAQAADNAGPDGRWRFSLRLPGGDTSIEAGDHEPDASPERLELLAVVRGLEALDTPSQVTLVSGSRHIRRGLEFGLSQWRENDWQWERYGRMTPVKNGDLWRRVDRLLGIHSVECRPAAVRTTDDLAAPPEAKCKTTSGGRRLRIDAAEPARMLKQGARNPKSETNAKAKRRKFQNKKRFRNLNFGFSNLSRISNFVLRILGWWNTTDLNET
jgi:ribonuclease HI